MGKLQQDIANLQADDHPADAVKRHAAVYAEGMGNLGIDLEKYTGQDLYNITFVLGNYGAKAETIPTNNPELGQKLQADLAMISPDNLSSLSEENRNILLHLDSYLEQAGLANPHFPKVGGGSAGDREIAARKSESVKDDKMHVGGRSRGQRGNNPQLHSGKLNVTFR